MKTFSVAIAVGALAWGCFAGCQQTHQQPSQGQSPQARVIQETVVEVRYRLPNQESLKGESSSGRWGLAAPVEAELSDPNRIVYDQSYVEKYVDWAANTPIADGPGIYVIVTPQGERSVSSGRDAAYLGKRFSAEHLVGFLQARTAGKSVERTFQVNSAEAVKALRDYPESLAAKRLNESPWDRDTRAVIQLLGLVPYEPAHPQLVALAKDANPGIQFDAIIALGRIARGVPAAIDDLEKLLDDKATRRTAASALAMAGEPALPAIMRALDHPDETARNHVVFSLGRHADPDVAVPALRKVLVHPDAQMREWGVAVIVDLITGGGPEAGQPFVAELATRLVEDPNENTRRGAALALLNMKSLAAPAEAALRHAAEKDQNSQARDFAQRALQALKDEPEQQP